jgi:hypothetical protein
MNMNLLETHDSLLQDWRQAFSQTRSERTQRAVSREHLDYYLDKFTFRFNRRNSKSRGKLFYRLVQQAVSVEPVPYKAMVKCYSIGAEANHNL